MIPEVQRFGLDFALPAMFIALLLAQLKARTHFFIAVLAGALSLFLLQLGFSQWHVIVATVIGASVGVLVEPWIKK